ncbi:MAG: HAMP domain-containing sensor histidine kinase [Agathobaculum sp.]|uniref:sensor histidine kinase n=1 Tax=Agathobaculum sp. TaxID=2048138 RepID=UPI002A8091A2|nr:HAMP domain-containing sensor histidine kinase [Agathobaculum sp.]MDY3711063.1 HAMP domain-containing sensor histidine kinase [Agathobaculum sp.]
MKTVGRMVRRYILATFAIVLLVLTVNTTLFAGIVIHYGSQSMQEGFFPVGKFAESFARTEDGYSPDPSLEWQQHFAWAMLLSDSGEILWSEDLPAELNHPYTVPEVAAFSRWYLKDYPVMVYRNDYGLLVAGKPKGSMTRFDFYMDNDILYALLSTFRPLLLLDLGLVLAICLWLGWRGARPLRALAEGIGLLSEGKTVQLTEVGTTAELAEKLNQTSRNLQLQSELIQRRDMTRANWIAGVSHDIRTPLALIMGYGEQLARQFPPQSEPRKKADAICTQSKKIKALIEDLNLTFKLQYNAQPLRKAPIQIGAWLRRCVADFCDSLEENYSVDLLIREPAGQATLEADEELLTRAVDNLLNNSVRHNPSGCDIWVTAEIADEQFVLEVRDNGAGYPEAVLRNLSDTCSDPNAPHILGLHLVRQIAAAHGGQASFRNDSGAVAVLHFPIAQ